MFLTAHKSQHEQKLSFARSLMMYETLTWHVELENSFHMPT